MSHEGHMGEVEKAIQGHVESHHLGLSKEQIEGAFEEHYSLIENGRKLDMIVDDYFGEPVADIDGEVHRVGGSKQSQEERWRYTEEVLKRTDSRLKTVEHAFQNGGVPAKLNVTRNQKIGFWAVASPILVASVTVIGQLIIHIIP